jgi:hypothetical protein
MEKYQNAGNLITPFICLDPESGMLEIKGRSIPENPIEFYTPLIDALDEYAKSPMPLTQVTLKLEYYNSSSSKCLLEIFKKLEKMRKNGADIKINWLYDEQDDGMLTAGEDYQVMLDLSFVLVPVIE